MRAQTEAQVKTQAVQAKAGLEAQVAQARLALQREQMDRETDLKQQEIVSDARIAAYKAALGGHGGGPVIRYGGSI
jgi:Flp pilus assembly protein TadG